MSLKDRYFYTNERNNELQFNLPMFGVDVIIAFVVLLLFLWIQPIKSVPTGSRGVITVGGKIKGIESEGFLLVAPWHSLNIFNIRAEEATIENAEGSTSDTQPVKVSLTVRYSILPDKVSDVFEKYSKDGDLSSYVQTATQEVFKAVTAKYTAPDLIGKRAMVSMEIVSALKAKLDIYGAQVINVDMRGFAFSDDYMTAINAKTTQEQLKLGAENKVKTVEAQQREKVIIAEAEANALKAKSDGEAYSNLKIASAQAESLKIQGNALVQNPTVLELRKVEVELAKANKWDGKLPEAIYAGTPVPFFNPMTK
jgi:regulator of protease activity HflC (stomatin/prohibitin superfamily)